MGLPSIISACRSRFACYGDLSELAIGATRSVEHRVLDRTGAASRESFQAIASERRFRHEAAPSTDRPKHDSTRLVGSGVAATSPVPGVISTWAAMLPALLAVGGPGGEYGPIVTV